MIILPKITDIQQLHRENHLKKHRKEERIGIMYVVLVNSFTSFGTFWRKVIQYHYSNDFKTIQFLFLYSNAIIAFALTYTYITKVPLVNPLTLNHKFWFFIRTNVNFIGISTFTLCLWYLRSSIAQILVLMAPIVVLVLS